MHRLLLQDAAWGERAAEDAGRLLGSAPGLQELELVYDSGEGAPGWELVAALGQPCQLRRLALRFERDDKRWTQGLPPCQLQPLAATLPHLQFLTYLLLDQRVPSCFLEALGPASAPHLRHLQLWADGCLHDWLHEAPVYGLLLRCG